MSNPFLTHSTVGSLYEAVLIDAIESVYKAPFHLFNGYYKKAEEGVEDWIYLHTFTPSTYCFSFFVISAMFEFTPQELSSLIEQHLKQQWEKKGILPYAQALYYWK